MKDKKVPNLKVFFFCSTVVAAKNRPSQQVSIDEDILDEEDEFEGVKFIKFFQSS